MITENVEPEPDPKPSHQPKKTDLKSFKKPSEPTEQLKAENAELKKQNAEMRDELHKIEAKYQRIAQLLDQVPAKLNSRTVILEEPERKCDPLIDSVDSQATFVDENEIANKNIFSSGIMQMIGKVHGGNSPKNKKCVSMVPETATSEVGKLRKEVEKQRKIIKEYREFIVQLMGNLQLVAEDYENQSRTGSVRSFFQ